MVHHRLSVFHSRATTGDGAPVCTRLAIYTVWHGGGGAELSGAAAGAVDEWPEGLYEAEMRVAAFQNGYFTALCNRVREEDCLTFSGESFACGPDGAVIARGRKFEEEIVYADIDLSTVRQSHARRLFLQHRRPELYSGWVNLP